jgi:hypothetical protein
MKAAPTIDELDSLIAIARHKAGQNALKSELRKLRLRTITRTRPPMAARKALDNEIPSSVELSEEVTAMRKRERH